LGVGGHAEEVEMEEKRQRQRKGGLSVETDVYVRFS
jgi:hypothetical protein